MLPTPKSFSALYLAKQIAPDQSKLVELSRFSIERDAIHHAELEETLRAVSRRFERIPLKERVLGLYTNNRIHLLNNRDTVKVPTMLPAWRVRPDGNVVLAYVNATPYVPSSGASSVDPRRLYGMLSLGAVLVDAYDQWPKISASLPLGKTGAAVYSRMMHKVADRITGAGMDRMRSDQLKYVFAKYFLVGMLGRAATETADATAAETVAGTARAALSQFETDAAASAGVSSQKELYALDLGAFLEALSKAAPWASRLTVRGFIQTFVSLYGAPSMLAMEDAGYFFALMSTHQAGADVMSSYAVDPIYGREGDEMLDELARLVR